MIKATIHEMGNGLPEVGDYVPGVDDSGIIELYCVVSIDSRIQTGACGCGNWVQATVELADWDDCSEDEEYPAQVRV